MYRRAIAFLITGLFFTITARAGVVPGRWEKVQAEKPGTEMIITLSSGEEFEAVFKELTADSFVMTLGGSERALPKSGVRKVTTAERRTGPLWNGPVIGAAVGALIAIIGANVDDVSGDDAWIAIPIVAGIGAGIGLGVDAAFQTRITLYKAPGMD
ncbi:MAG: hypothetical protein EHM61_04360 [Acidobacteria bacterium]|nr:MAG: hypothetical protein EHM61_04360 [Acidobacteriota bacterium]